MKQYLQLLIALVSLSTINFVNGYYQSYFLSIEISPQEPRVGLPLQLRCQVRPQNNKFTFKWYKDNQYITSGSDLTLSTLTVSDLGNYKCEAEIRDNDSYFSGYTTRQIYDTTTQPAYSLDISTEPSRFQQNKPLTLNCNVSPYTDNVKYEWLKNNQLISNEKQLYFSNFIVNGRDDYECRVKINSPNGVISKLSYSMWFEGTYVPSVKIDNSAYNYRIDIRQNPSTFYYGDRVVLECLLNGPPANVQFSWLKNDRIVQYGKDLVIPKFGRDDVANYKCKVKGRDQNGNEIGLYATYSYS